MLVSVVGCVVLTGCGASHAPSTPRQVDAGFPVGHQVSARMQTRQRALHDEVLARLHSPVSRQKPGAAGYLPSRTTKINRVVVATRSHPQLAIAGDSVELHLTSGRTLATMNGPLYNNKYVGTNDPTVPAKFLLTFTRTHGTIPLAPRDFTILDQQGDNIVPSIRVRGGGSMPERLASGRRLTLSMSTIIAAGDGSIVFNPTGFTKSGHLPLAGWDFIVEDD